MLLRGRETCLQAPPGSAGSRRARRVPAAVGGSALTRRGRRQPADSGRFVSMDHRRPRWSSVEPPPQPGEPAVLPSVRCARRPPASRDHGQANASPHPYRGQGLGGDSGPPGQEPWPRGLRRVPVAAGGLARTRPGWREPADVAGRYRQLARARASDSPEAATGREGTTTPTSRGSPHGRNDGCRPPVRVSGIRGGPEGQWAKLPR